LGACRIQSSTVAVSLAPATPSAANNSPVCAGQGVQLTAATVPNATTYQWTGPAGFSSAAQNPFLSAAQPSASGPYLVTANANGCSSPPATTNVLVQPLPTAVVSGSAQICAGSSDTLQAALSGTAPWTVTWSDGVTQAGIATSPATRSVQPASSTTYTVSSVSDAHCSGTASGSAVIAIDGTCTRLFTLPPCRVVDTRSANGPLGGPVLQPGSVRGFSVLGACGIPPTAKALAVNVTITQAAAAGDLRLYPGDVTPAPLASTINWSVGAMRANNALVRLPADGSGTINARVDSAGSVHFILDVMGYFE